MATSKKAAPKKAEPKKNIVRRIIADVKPEVKKLAAKIEGNAKATVHDLINGAAENIKYQLSQPHFKHLTFNDIAKDARTSIIASCKTGAVDCEMAGKQLYDHITKELGITDK